ncbi:MAG: thioether cross-link-forming SCIFF peptide maturase [Bacillota bacterium]
MVHYLEHNYCNQNYYFLFDVESGSLHNVDYVAFLCAKKRYGEPLNDREVLDFENIPIKIKEEISNSFDEMENIGSLNSPPRINNFHKNAFTVKALCLNICHDCNMRCLYCFAKDGSYNTARDYMSFEVAKRSVDFLINNSSTRKNLEIDFFGGEPLLNLDVIKKTVEYAKKEGAKKKKIFNFTLTTNCVNLDDSVIDYLNREMVNIVLSIDGRKITHESVRKCLDKSVSYENILQKAKSVKNIRGDKSYYVRGTFTAKNLDFANDIIALNDAGFDQISIEPVVMEKSSNLAIKKEHIKDIKKEYERFANIYLDRRKTHKWFNFFHFMVDLDCGPCVNKRLTGCGAGTEYLSVSPTGDIYPCHQFVGDENFVLGNVFEGVKKQDIRNEFSKISVLSKEKCQNCFAKYYCGGGCIANAHKFGEGMKGVYEISCELMRKRLDLSLIIAGIEKLSQ